MQQMLYENITIPLEIYNSTAILERYSYIAINMTYFENQRLQLVSVLDNHITTINDIQIIKTVNLQAKNTEMMLK